MRASSLLLAAPVAWVGAISAYLGVLTVAGWRAFLARQDHGDTSREGRNRFVVAIPAHDEAQLIAATLKSLGEQDYPADRYAVHVVADNCTDDTAVIARGLGAEVHERVSPERPGKGPALSWLLQRLDEQQAAHDAVVFIDADTVVSPSFLTAVDRRLAAGDRVVQGYYAVRDPASSWPVAIRAAALMVRHYLRPLARTSLGGSAGLYGNGMAFAADVLRDREWSDHLTEDIELEAQLLLDGERVAFAPDAVIEAEMPERLVDSRTQHERWERGRLQVTRHYVPALLKAATGRGGRQRVACVDAAVDHLVPPLSVLGLASAFTWAVVVVQWLRRPTGLRRANAAVATWSVAVQGAYVVSALRMVGAPPAVWRALLHGPWLAVWKLRVLGRATTGHRAGDWIRTRRNDHAGGAAR